jgi:hypothetical protein
VRIQRTFRQLSCSPRQQTKALHSPQRWCTKNRTGKARGRRKFGCHVRACNWIQPVLQQFPTLQNTDVASIEI